MATLAPAPAPALPTPACRNCGAPVDTPFCGHCGQSTTAQRLSVRGLLSDALEDQLSVNGSAIRSFLVLARPGFLTQEYLAGRVVRYAAPIRLFLLSLTAWVLATSYVVHREQPRIEAAVRAAMGRAQAREAANAPAGRPANAVKIVGMPIDSARFPRALRGLVRPIYQKQARINAMEPGRAVSLVVGAALRATSNAMLLLVPAVTGLLALIYVRRRRPFAEHFVFTLHVHAFGFAALALATLGQLAWHPLNSIGDLVVMAYVYVAMKRVYGHGWPGTAPRFFALGVLYLCLLVVLSPVLQLLVILSA